MRPKSKAFDHFLINTVNEQTRYLCSFCKTVYKYKNATKFVTHLKKCDKCPDSVKNSMNEDLPRKNTTPVCEPQASSSASNALREIEIVEYDEIKTHRAIARAIYVSGCPLSLLHHPLWIEALKLLNPAFNPPSRKVLSSTLLEQEYAEVHSNIIEKIRESHILHLAIDGWSNLRNESILNVVVYGPKPYFLKFIETKNMRHTAEYLFEEISKILEDFGAEKFFGVITDNAANMVKCGRLLKEKYDHIFWFGCLAHTFHLMINDILKISKIRNLFAFIVNIIKTIKSSHILNAEFKKLVEEKSMKISLSLPVKTRWGSYLQTLQNFYKCKIILQNLVINVNHQSLSIHRTKLLDETTWGEMEKIEKIITPIVKWIIRLEGDYCTVHLVHSAFKELDDLLGDSTTRLYLDDDMSDLVVKFQERKSNSLKPIHFAASILDPRSQGTHLTPEENIDGSEVIFNLTEPAKQNQLLEDLSHYKCRSGNWSKDFVWKMASNVEPLAWWEAIFSKTVLGQTALKILSLPATSAAVERSFSTFSNIHTMKRNRLKTSRAGKITFIAHNWKVMNRNTSNSVGGSALSVSNIEDNICSSSASNSGDEFSDIALSDNDESYSLEDQVTRRGRLISNTFLSDSE